MANISRLNQLNLRRSNWEIGVKILKKWVEIRQYRKDVLHFLLVDQQRTKIHAYVKLEDQELFKYFNQRMYEGQWKILKKFNVVNAPKTVGRFAENPFELILNEHTELDPAQGPDLPHYMVFEDFKHVKAGQRLTPNPLGYLDSVMKPTWVPDSTFTLIPNEKTTAFIKFTLKDTSGTSIKCLAYGELALQIDERWFKNGDNEVIMTLSDWKLAYIPRTGEYRVKSAAGISRFEFNADLPDVETFRRKYFEEKDNSSDDQSSSSVGEDSETSHHSSGSDENGSGAGPSGTAWNVSGNASELIIID